MKDEKDLIQYKNGSKGENPGQTKKNPAGGMDVCVCCKDGSMERKVT
jgi:hypothetical protein